VDVAKSFCYIFLPVQPSYTCYQSVGKLLNAWKIKWCTCDLYSSWLCKFIFVNMADESSLYFGSLSSDITVTKQLPKCEPVP